MHHKPLLLVRWPFAFGAVLMLFVSAARPITVGALQSELTNQTKVTVIDVRATDLFAQGHIPGAINIPASLCAQKILPPLGSVVVYDGGLGRDRTETAAAALATKPGITVDILEGGFAAWEAAQGSTTRPPGMSAQSLNYIAYAELKTAKASEVVLVDLRRPATVASTAAKQVASLPLSDLAVEFSGMATTKNAFAALGSRQTTGTGSTAPPLIVLIDSGDGTAETTARTLKANGVRRYVILAGGEAIIARKGRPGLERTGPGPHASTQNQTPGGGR